MKPNGGNGRPATLPLVRCAVYTRKTTEEGLEQEFNSLDAQREAAEAFVRSQAGEGWTLLPDCYDDGGFTGGFDWPSIKSLPVSDRALPSFWDWDDRRYAVWWDSEGRPFVQGPKMLVTYSGKPHIDAEKCALLDTKNCRAIFCHSDWFRDLIANNRGPANMAPIVTWPYPIDPWPGEPLPDEYDMLVYSRNGHRPGLLDYLCQVFPRHVVLHHYGQYKRKQLFEAARRSRACAYLADDLYGLLALQEILLAGCPVVGVRTGGSFIQDGVTGICVDRLPPGAK